MTSPSLRLFRHSLSGHCHRVEFLMSVLGLRRELVDVDLLAAEHKQPWFLSKNAFGQVPVLEDGELTLADSNAIMVYLAERFDSDGRLWPKSPAARAAVQRWLSVAAGPLVQGPGAARLARVFGRKLDHAAAVETAAQLFRVLEAELATRDYLVGDAVTLADLALYAYTARAPEGDVSLEPFPRMRAWVARIEAVPGFVPMAVALPR